MIPISDDNPVLAALEGGCGVVSVDMSGLPYDGPDDHVAWGPCLGIPLHMLLDMMSGHEPGEAISTPDDVWRYMDALAKAAPDRTRVVEYAKSWEGRPLKYMVVGSPARLAKLDEFPQQVRKRTI